MNIVANYDISKRITASATWVYATGLPVTFPTGRAVIGNAIIPIYSNRNAYRMPDYHRLDLSVSLKGKKSPGKNGMANGIYRFTMSTTGIMHGQ